jgi:hypothetical protein
MNITNVTHYFALSLFNAAVIMCLSLPRKLYSLSSIDFCFQELYFNV